MTNTGEAARPTPTIEAESLGELWIIHQKKILVGAIVSPPARVASGCTSAPGRSRKRRAAWPTQAAEASFMGGNQAIAIPELEKVVSRYQGTTAGTQAAMLIAQSLMDQGKGPEAVTVLESALRSAPKSLTAGVQSLIGAAYESQGKPTEAAAAYARAAAASAFVQDRDMHLIEQARNLVAANDLAGAEKIYAEMARREDSPFAGEARVRLGEVIGKK
jgi:tetratricopeptide (TPR) repeat protein